MKKISTLALMSLLGSFFAVAQAQTTRETGFYTELGAAQAYYRESAGNFNNTMGVFKAGYDINKYVAAEVMAAGNLNSANFYVGSTYVNAKISSAYGGYGKFQLPVNEQFSFFVRLGVTSSTATYSTRWGSGWASGTDFSYGGGAQFNFTKNVYGQVDYMSYYNKNNVTAVAPSISVGYKF